MRVLSLFSGGGLGDYGLELAGMEIVGQVEIDDYCQKILALRWPEVPKWRDIKGFSGTEFVHRYGPPDIISGGFPCQDISQAGRGAGIKGERSGLWKEMLRIIREIRPRYVLVENVAILLGRGLGVVLGNLAESGYDAEWDCIPASALGAPHQRDRIWIMGYAKHDGQPATENRGTMHEPSKPKEQEAIRESPRASHLPKNVADAEGERKRTGLRAGAAERVRRGRPSNGGRAVVNASSIGRKRCRSSRKGRSGDPDRRKVGNPERFGSQGKSRRRAGTVFADGCPSREHSRWWAAESRICRVVNGCSKRVDRLKLLGNGQVVQVVEYIGRRIMESASA